MMRRVRSSKSGHTNSNFCINSGRVVMLRKHITVTHKLIPGGFKSEAQRLVNELKLRACENWPRFERTLPKGSETRA